MPDHWRIALIDSGLNRESAARPIAASRFMDTGTGVVMAPIVADAGGHGTRIAAIVLSAPAVPDLLLAQVFDHSRATTAAAVAAAVRWALAQRANLIHMSLGLRDDRAALAGAVAQAVASGCLVVASTPARGPTPYPARYPEVIRASGDARCAPDDISALNAAQACFGACPGIDAGARAGGASFAAAHLTRFIVTHVGPGADFAAACARLAPLARFRGIERRTH